MQQYFNQDHLFQLYVSKQLIVTPKINVSPIF